MEARGPNCKTTFVVEIERGNCCTENYMATCPYCGAKSYLINLQSLPEDALRGLANMVEQILKEKKDEQKSKS